MKQPFYMQKTVLILLVSLMVSLVWVLFSSLRSTGVGKQVSERDALGEPDWGVIESEAGVFTETDSSFKMIVAKNRKTLGAKGWNRAYPGAPPQISHPVQESVAASGGQCLSCHRQGGYTAKFKAYAPVAPHPQYESCRQCHTPKTEDRLFRSTAWVRKKQGNRGFAHLPGSPPVIPHPLHLRANCLSCHSGPSAVTDIRTTHPERINCRQCHVPVLSEKIFSRSANIGGQ